MASKLASLAIDLAPKTKTIEVKDGVSIEIRGLKSGEIAEISGKYPDFGEFINSANRAGAAVEMPADGEEISPEAAAKMTRNIDFNQLFALGGSAYPAIIAAAVGEHNDPETQKIAAGFAPDFQSLIVGEIMSMTFARETRRRPLATPQDGSGS